MTSDWHAEVGLLFVGSLLIQAVTGLVLWISPYVLFLLKRALKAGGVVHKFDMEDLYTGPEIDLPKFLGKAYAVGLCIFAYSAVLPILYAIGVLFFFGTWFFERYALIRVHRTPPPYSFELITSTLGWLPWAVAVHIGFAFWSYASLPALPLGDTWTRPFGVSANGTSSVTGIIDMGGASTGLAYVYDISGHVNSYPTLILFIGAFALTASLVLLCLRSTPLYLPLRPVELAVRAGVSKGVAKVVKRSPKVAPNGLGADGELDGDDVVDPPFSKVIEGVTRTDVRVHEGKVVHQFQTEFQQDRWAKCKEFLPTLLLFRVLGMRMVIEPISMEEWKEAKKVYTQIDRAADVSYQPEFHPTYEKAFVYMADPSKLAAFIAAADAEEARKARAAAKAAEESSEEESDGKVESSEESDSDEVKPVKKDAGKKAPAAAPTKSGGATSSSEMQVEDMDD